MKKICLAFIVAVLLAALATGCGDNGKKDDTMRAYDCESTCIKTSFWSEKTIENQLIGSYEEYEAFLSQLSGNDIDIGFLDDDFFETKKLAVGVIPTNSGSNSYELKKVYLNENGICFEMKKKTSDMGTTDMATWFVFAAMEADDIEGIPENITIQ